MEDAEIWLNTWETSMREQHIHTNEFLTMTTAEGLRVTLRSTIELPNYLLWDCGFEYVLTGKMNQDPLEVIMHFLIFTFQLCLYFLYLLSTVIYFFRNFLV